MTFFLNYKIELTLIELCCIKMQTIACETNNVIHESYIDTTYKHIVTCVNRVTT